MPRRDWISNMVQYGTALKYSSSLQNLNVCNIHDGNQPFPHIDLVRKLCLNGERGKGKQKLDPMIISSIPFAGNAGGNLENARTFPCAPPRQCRSHPPFCLNFSLSLIFTVCACLIERTVARGTPLSDRRIQTEHGRGVSPNGGTC